MVVNNTSAHITTASGFGTRLIECISLFMLLNAIALKVTTVTFKINVKLTCISAHAQ